MRLHVDRSGCLISLILTVALTLGANLLLHACSRLMG
jgi:hypothetical protein